MSWFSALAALSGVSFLLYGLSCLRSPVMIREFERFGLARFRALAGTLELLGGAGLLVGLWYLPLLAAAALGLAVLMLLAGGVRIRRQRDGLWLTLPAVALFLVNGALALEAWRRLGA